MNESSLKKTLAKLNLGGLRYFESLGSTNDEALAWAAEGAKDLSIVIANEQTQGRGRLRRAWFTPKGSAIALSAILRPVESLRPHLSRTVGLAALSVTDAFLKLGLAPRIKWPNDILVNGKKTAGILVETVWSGEDIDSLVIGVGLNVHKASVPPRSALRFPASSLEDELPGEPPAREELVFDILSALAARRESMHTDDFMKAWNELLAYRGEQVQVSVELDAEGAKTESPVMGRLVGLEDDGSLRLDDARGEPFIVRFGDVSLRPAA
jgi:BirA family biotin operon repressor/biotin-[acetyl-CoA-carboxylase] ligase